MEFGLHTILYLFFVIVFFFSVNIHFLCARQGENRTSFISVAGGLAGKKRVFLPWAWFTDTKLKYLFFVLCFFHRFLGFGYRKVCGGLNHMMNTNFFPFAGLCALWRQGNHCTVAIFRAAPWDIIMGLVLPPISVHNHTNALYIAGCMTFGPNLGAAESIVTDTGSAGAACKAVFKRRKSPTHQAREY